MKICTTIAEYNPLHLGHIKHINYIKNTLGAEKLIVLMSGNFCQRGQMCVLSKFTRARQAIIAGADMVIELPTVFANGNAETFALGGINIIDSLNVADGFCFGAENGNKNDFIFLAKALINESGDFKKTLKAYLEQGISLAKAKWLTVKDLYGDINEDLMQLPNNILGVEYTKALLKRNSTIELFPMLREGNHNDTRLKKGITSASSIRECLKAGKKNKIKKYVPPFVYRDLTTYPFGIEKLIMTKVLTEKEENMKLLPDCTEGLENRIKALSKDSLTVEELVNKVTTKRYTSSRIRRILISNLLGITENLKNECLSKPLYAKILAVNSQSKDLISLLSSNSSIPILTRKSDSEQLKKTAKKCFEIDCLAQDLYNLATDTKENENYMVIV